MSSLANQLSLLNSLNSYTQLPNHLLSWSSQRKLSIFIFTNNNFCFSLPFYSLSWIYFWLSKVVGDLNVHMTWFWSIGYKSDIIFLLCLVYMNESWTTSFAIWESAFTKSIIWSTFLRIWSRVNSLAVFAIINSKSLLSILSSKSDL